MGSGVLTPSPHVFGQFGSGEGGGRQREAFEMYSYLWHLESFIGENHKLQLRLGLRVEGSLVMHHPLICGFCDLVQPLMGSWQQYRYRRRATSPISKRCLICTHSPSSSSLMFTLQTCRGQDRYDLPFDILPWGRESLKIESLQAVLTL